MQVKCLIASSVMHAQLPVIGHSELGQAPLRFAADGVVDYIPMFCWLEVLRASESILMLGPAAYQMSQCGQHCADMIPAACWIPGELLKLEGNSLGYSLRLCYEKWLLSYEQK